MNSSDVGYIRLWRKFRNNELWKKPRVFSEAEAWLDILMEVRWSEEPCKVLLGMRVIECGFAQSLNSIDTWAKRWRWSRTRAYRFMKLLQSQNMIRTETVQKTTRLTVCNFKEYQKMRTDNETQMKRKRNANETQVNTEEEGKEYKEGNLKTLSASFDAVGGNGDRFYMTRKKRKLTGKRLETFERFWQVFSYPKGKAEAADAWLDIPSMTNAIVEEIIAGAQREAEARSDVIAAGKTPKMAQGWISGRRWEDEVVDADPLGGWGLT